VSDLPTFGSGPRPEPISCGEKRTIITPLTLGLTDSHMLLPLMFPLVLEFSLVNSASQCCAAQVYGADASQSFEITNCRILCDIVRCDAVILEELRKVLDAGNPLPIHIASYATSQHTLSLNTPARTAVYAPAAQSWSIQLSRAFTRIKTIFVTHESDESHGTTRTQCDTFTSWTGAAPWDNPNYTLEKYPVRSAEDYRFQLQLGARLWPDIPLSNHAEAHMRLGQVIGMNSTVIGHSILPGEWLQTSFIQAMDMEKGSANRPRGLAWWRSQAPTRARQETSCACCGRTSTRTPR
jgi:hypothetical protein